MSKMGYCNWCEGWKEIDTLKDSEYGLICKEECTNPHLNCHHKIYDGKTKAWKKDPGEWEIQKAVPVIDEHHENEGWLRKCSRCHAQVVTIPPGGT